MRKVFLIIDQDKENNDKEWLVEELKRHKDFDTSVIYARKSLPPMWVGGKKSKFKAYQEIFYQLIVAKRAINSEKSICYVITWNMQTGLLAKFILPPNAIIFALNWLTPDGRILNTNVRRICLKDSRFYPFADQNGTRLDIIQYYKIKNENKVDFFPDTFSSLGEFINVNKSIIERRRRKNICFIGGFNNRNWNLLYKVAKEISEINFVAIGVPENYNNPKLDNLESYTQTDVDTYYNLMREAYLIYLPLCDQRAAGAINLYKASQNHQLCIITNTPSTFPYFPPEYNDQLIKDNNVNTHVNLIKQMFSISDDEYIRNVTVVRNFLLNEFSVEKVVNKIFDKINELQKEEN